MSKSRLFLVAASLLMAVVLNATRIIILADVHVTPGNENDTRLREAVEEINAMPADFVVMNGDLTNEGSDAELKYVKSVLDEIRLPLFVLPGNHESTWSQSATKTFIDLWGNDRFVTETDSLVIVGMNCGPFMKMGDGHIKQEDIYWLDRTLTRLAKDGKRVVSFNHYPILKDLDNWVDYVKVLERYPVACHVNGHYHKNEKYRGGDIDAQMVRALSTKNGFGYTVMDITPDSVLFSEKLLGQDLHRISAFPINTKFRPIEHILTENPDTTLRRGLKPFNPLSGEGVRPKQTITLVYSDSASIFTRLGFDKNAIYFGNSLGEAKALSKKSGKILWSTPTGASVFSRPVVTTKKTVVFPSAAKELLTLSTADGSIVNRMPSDGPYVADGVLVKGALYQGGYKKMEKFDAKSGKLLWRFSDIGNYCQAAPAVDHTDLIFGAWDTYLYCLDTRTGALKWKWNNGKNANQLGPGDCSPVVTADKVFLVAPDRFMTCLDRSTGKEIWRVKDKKVRESIGISADCKRVYAKTMDGEMLAVDATADEYSPLWITDMGIGYEHAPCILLEHNGIVYTGSRQGIVSAVDALTGELLWNADLGVSEVNGIDLDPTTGDIYVSLIEGRIWQIK
ncbi:MAG: PQQ-binding-like beta-propeller repeat protein [Muribaculaceae bacterium]|nr:PQQ-binding-like beta-propeller repeat protein [Muribaculaceae bacterium]